MAWIYVGTRDLFNVHYKQGGSELRKGEITNFLGCRLKGHCPNSSFLSGYFSNMMDIVFEVNRPQITSRHIYILGHVHLSASASIALILLPRGFL